MLLVAVAVGAIGGLISTGGCAELRGARPERHDDNCTTCHGSPVRGGDDLLQSAPPFDLEGKTATSRRGVGAHLIHLQESDITSTIACSECHVVPETTDSPGHADDAYPAEVALGPRSRLGEATPSYDRQGVSCVNVYCHGEGSVSWLPSSSGTPRCARCHGDPPAAPHPADDRCHLCHGEVVDASRAIIDASKHIDGVVQAEERCDTCHGGGELGLPPPDLAGRTDVTAVGVGAHVVHAAGGIGARAVACGECHAVPAAVGDEGHLDDGTPFAEVALTGVAASDGRAPTWDRDQRRCVDSWCHGPSTAGGASPLWTSTAGPLSCTGCHGNPPSAPHPQMTDCRICHAPVSSSDGGIAMPDLHVDGIVQVLVPTACDACHGSGDLGAPPPDLSGNSDPSLPGVGAHAIHLASSGPYRQVECGDCHDVPASVLDGGHIDSFGPAEVDFGGVAKAFSASPTYDGVSCSGTWCHGGKTAFGFPSGGTNNAPGWTDPQTGLTCTSCHGMPPPTPAHPPPPTLCTPCHSNVQGLGGFVDPSLHVNGFIDL